MPCKLFQLFSTIMILSMSTHSLVQWKMHTLLGVLLRHGKQTHPKPWVHREWWPFCTCFTAHAMFECPLLSPLVWMGAPKCFLCRYACVSACNNGVGVLFSIPYRESKTTTCPDEQTRPCLAAHSPRKQIDGMKEWGERPKKMSLLQCCMEQTCLAMSNGTMEIVKSSLSLCWFYKKREKQYMREKQYLRKYEK